MKIKINDNIKNLFVMSKEKRNKRNRKVIGSEKLTNNILKENIKEYDNIIKDINFRKKSTFERVLDEKIIEEVDNSKKNIIKYKRKGAYNVSYNDEIKEEKDEDSQKSKIRKRKTVKKIKVPKSYYSLLFLMVILGGVSVKFALNSYNDFNEEDYAVYNSIDVGDQSSISNVAQGEYQDNSTNNADTKNNETSNTTVKTQSVQAKVQPLSFSKPLEGEILKMYSKDKVIYSKTLELWKTHDGIDIKADIGTDVKSIEKGTIEKVYDDSFYGKTIVIDHGQGYKSSYSNLDENVYVQVKQVVKKGTKIGKIGKTSIGEIKDDSHLHFTLMKNNEIVDPTSIFK